MSDVGLFDQSDSTPSNKRNRKQEVASVPAVRGEPSMMQVIAQLAANPNVDTAKMQSLIEIHRQTEAKQQFHDAMILMDEQLPKINRDGKIAVRGGVLRFASFENINKVIKPILRSHGFRMTYEPDVPASGQGIIVHCHLTRGLYRESCIVPVPTSSASPAMNAQQAVGAAIAYAKRYGTIALLNLETEAPDDRDTDARAASDGKTITGSQAKKLLQAIENNGVPGELFKKHWLDYFGISAVHEIPADQFDGAMKSCTDYGKKKKAVK